jgi:hypothetical protein
MHGNRREPKEANYHSATIQPFHVTPAFLPKGPYKLNPDFVLRSAVESFHPLLSQKISTLRRIWKKLKIPRSRGTRPV